MSFSSAGSSSQAGPPKYLRQEIRGFIGTATPESPDPSSITSTPTATVSNKSGNSENSVTHSGPPISGFKQVNLEQSNVASQQISNRLSRLPSQMQQQHFKNLWKHYLYELQQKSPTPKRVLCRYNIASRPSHYGREFHGIMTRDEADQLLLEEGGDDGRYLVRESARTTGQMTLSLRFNSSTKNFRLYHDHDQHYVNELKRFNTVHELVADGLITLYMELHAADYIANLTRECRYEESPYMTLHRRGGAPMIRSTPIGQHHRPVSQALSLPPAPPPPQSSSASKPQSSSSPKQQNQSQSYSSSSPIENRASNVAQLPKQQKSKSQPSSVNHNRRSMFDSAAAHKPILLLTQEELSAPDEVYLAPCDTGLSGSNIISKSGAIITGSSAGNTTAAAAATNRFINIQAYEKAHHFRTHTFIGNPWCDYCGNFIWGLIGQGVRCDDCGFSAHRKCSELVPNDCCPDLSRIRRIFGVDLTTFIKASNSLRPFVVDLLIGEVERRGMTIEGIYRACGSSDEIETLKDAFETHWEQADAYLRSVEDIHVITGLLKLYLRLLPIPLITFDAYPQFIEAVKKTAQESINSGLREALAKLPPAHYQTLKFLIIHLNRVSIHESRNLMSAKNLSLIFGQTLLYTPNIPMMFQFNCWELESKVIELLIVLHNKIFIK